jgi:hypothetical protein
VAKRGYEMTIERAGVCIMDGSLAMADAHLAVRQTEAYRKIRELYPLDRYRVAWVGSEVVCGCWHVTFEAQSKDQFP